MKCQNIHCGKKITAKTGIPKGKRAKWCSFKCHDEWQERVSGYNADKTTERQEVYY